jgi:hypothetical protein
MKASTSLTDLNEACLSNKISNLNNHLYILSKITSQLRSILESIHVMVLKTLNKSKKFNKSSPSNFLLFSKIFKVMFSDFLWFTEIVLKKSNFSSFFLS